MVEFSISVEAETTCLWTLSVDWSSSLEGSGVEIVMERLDEVLLEQSLCFGFKDSNNQIEYEALTAGMMLALEVGAISLRT